MPSIVDRAHDLLDLDISTLRQYIDLFPNEGLAKVITGYLSSGVSKYPLAADGSSKDAPDLSEGGVALTQDDPVTQEDCLILMTEGIAEAGTSSLAHCLLGDFYLSLEEYESAVECARKGLTYTVAEAKKTDLSFQRTQDALNSTLATALVYYQAPRNHMEAKQIFISILKRKPRLTSALIGIGLVLEEEQEYDQAYHFLEQALDQDPSNGRIGAESAWCQALSGDYTTGLSRLEQYLTYPQLDASKPRGRELRAQTLYRIGVCLWELDTSRAARKSRQGPYAKLLAAIKANPNYAPAYTLLGIFYEDYNKDYKRARQCFHKAFELSPSEIVAAERLARLFANQGEWDIVELVAQRVVDSGKARQVPGSKRKGISWPYSALGVVQINRQEYQKSIVSFLHALRISPDDYYSYVGLGESYHNSGRYNSASRAFHCAETAKGSVVERTAEESWFTRYMLANVDRELGAFDDALQGYEAVLINRPQEFGVSIVLLQTLVEKGWRCIETGFFGEAITCALRAMEVAASITTYKPDAFNLWKTVGDACGLFASVQEKISLFPADRVSQILCCKSSNKLDFDASKDIDNLGQEALTTLTHSETSDLDKVIIASILSHKRALSSCVDDAHAQAVAWYNLGWAEHRAHVCLEQEINTPTNSIRYLRAAMKCFKRAIELEAGNAEFWNSLGVVTTRMSPKVAQHAFVRSLHLNERNAHTWTNLGTLYLLNNDIELAHQAFSRAQSQDPDYSLAWVGEGIIALLTGHTNEALSHFTHAFDLSESSLPLPKRQYVVFAFDALLSSQSTSGDIISLIQPLFALRQLSIQAPYDIPHKHLTALFLERIGSHDLATSVLRDVAEATEQEYEQSMSGSSALTRVVQAKIDLARNLLSAFCFEAAVEEAETALDLIPELSSDAKILTAHGLARITLSARLTAGLAHYFKGSFDSAVAHFRKSLEATKADPDVICILAQVLWAKGGSNEKDVAREQLFTAIEKHEDHVDLLTLIGAMTVLDEDTQTAEIIKDDLDQLRTKRKLSDEDYLRVGRVIEAISVSLGGKDQALQEAKRNVMLGPWKYNGWAELTDAVDGDGFPSIIARDAAARNAPPHGRLDADHLAYATCRTGNVGDAQRAVMLAPWCDKGWSSLTQCVRNA